MFDLAWSEIILVAVVGLLVIGPKEIPTVIRFCKNTLHKLRSLSKEVTDSFKELDPIDDLKKETEKLNEDIRYIVDLEGNLQPTYDLSDVVTKPEVKKVDKNK